MMCHHKLSTHQSPATHVGSYSVPPCRSLLLPVLLLLPLPWTLRLCAVGVPQVYECLGLNAEQAAAYVEHNGSLDMLRCVVSYLRRAQAGHGVVAVSPRWAHAHSRAAAAALLMHGVI
jgi:hypothetical protein